MVISIYNHKQKSPYFRQIKREKKGPRMNITAFSAHFITVLGFIKIQGA